MDKEIDKIITKLEGCFGIFDYVLTPIESNLLVSYIRELQQENKKQKDNWNKLKEYISTEWYSYDNDSVEFEVAKDILDKMEEMIGGDK